jgi:hypothetical protein
MIMVGLIGPIGGTELTRGWDRCRTPGPISFFSLDSLLHLIGGRHG